MDENKKTIEVLNDLVRINQDRVNGYEKAADECKDADMDLKTLFTKMASDSRTYKAELSSQVSQLGGDPATDTTQSGKIYRVWMDVKATFSGKDRHAILSSCEFGEDAAQKAYDQSLSSDADLPADIRQLIVTQQSALKTAHDEIKKLRDITKG